MKIWIPGIPLAMLVLLCAAGPPVAEAQSGTSATRPQSVLQPARTEAPTSAAQNPPQAVGPAVQSARPQNAAPTRNAAQTSKKKTPPPESRNDPQVRATKSPVRDSTRTFGVKPLNAMELRNAGVVLQERDFSCGAAALATMMVYQWHSQVTETQILVALVLMMTKEEMQDRIKNGLTLTDLRRLSAKLGYQAVMGKLTIDKLRESKVPLIVGITVNDFNHFVIYRGMDDAYVYIADPARGKIRVPIEEFDKQWQQHAVLVVLKRDADLTKPSPLMATAEEKSLGVVTDQALRRQLTGGGSLFR
jgi:predicted double-glycine peptidase